MTDDGTSVVQPIRNGVYTDGYYAVCIPHGWTGTARLTSTDVTLDRALRTCGHGVSEHRPSMVPELIASPSEGLYCLRCQQPWPCFDAVSDRNTTETAEKGAQ